MDNTKKIVRVYLDLTYHCWAEKDSIQRTKQTLLEDIQTLLYNDELWSCISFDVDEEAVESDVLEWEKELKEESNKV